MRYNYMGMWDNSATHGAITGSGDGFAEAMRKFAKRRETESQPGTWRRAPTKWKQNKGTRIDPDWYVVDYGQDE